MLDLRCIDMCARDARLSAAARHTAAASTTPPLLHAGGRPPAIRCIKTPKYIIATLEHARSHVQIGDDGAACLSGISWS
jgi:hypothetical protein